MVKSSIKDGLVLSRRSFNKDHDSTLGIPKRVVGVVRVQTRRGLVCRGRGVGGSTRGVGPCTEIVDDGWVDGRCPVCVGRGRERVTQFRPDVVGGGRGPEDFGVRPPGGRETVGAQGPLSGRPSFVSGFRGGVHTSVPSRRGRVGPQTREVRHLRFTPGCVQTQVRVTQS